MGRDLLDRPYGRFYHLPAAWAALGHDIRMALFHQRPAGPYAGLRHGLEWRTFDPVRRPLESLREIHDYTRDFRPDWIVGFSDTYYGLLAVHLARHHQARALVDAYDNYASYVGWCRPLHRAWFRAVAAADLVTVAGPSLAALFAAQGRSRPTMVVPMAVDPAGFHLRDRFRARAQFGLPTLSPCIGYFGSIARSRGIAILFEAWQRLREDIPETRLLLGGRLESNLPLPNGVDFLGYLPDATVPTAMACADVIAVVNKASNFGDYSYPIKLYEALAMGIPAVASATASTRWILRDHPQLLVEPENAEALAAALKRSMTDGLTHLPPARDWVSLAEDLSRELESVTRQARSR